MIDPMSGSGTVLKEAAGLGLRAEGFDVDPLAVMMTRASIHHVDDGLLGHSAERFLAAVDATPNQVWLPWIDEDAETSAFVDYWFAAAQQRELRKIAAQLSLDREQISCRSDQAISDVLHIALSRIIVTKEQAASLARDTSHSRPHRVSLTSAYDVREGFARSITEVRKRLRTQENACHVRIGDARKLTPISDASADAVMTSPPYLNAIDYMRGHRLSLVWMGQRLSELRQIRGSSVGTERGLDGPHFAVAEVAQSMGALNSLPSRYSRMATRYASDLIEITKETARVLKPCGSATFVVGNSCLRGVYINNADALAAAAGSAGLTQVSRIDRELPIARRYLPVTGTALAKRMKTETVFTFEKRLAA